MSEAEPSPAAHGAEDAWVDVRMQDPDAGEWTMDAVVVDGRVEYVDLRIKRSLLASFVDCLVDDVGSAGARAVLERVAATHDIDVELPTEDGDGA